MQRIVKIIAILFFMPLVAFANSFQAGKEYQLIKNPPALNLAQGQVQVIEFFSPGCPWCFKLEPYLEKWLASKPKNITFERIPVAFEQGWDTLAKAYYAAEALGVADKMVPVMFNAIHEQQLDLSSKEALADLFAKHGVKKDDFMNAIDFSPGIDMQMQQGQKLMSQYGILSIPTIVVNGKYKTNPALANGDSEKMMKIVDYLVKKSA
ncbi:MAG: thiol:disulfide interchange protein DsbA/DsbL [Legionellales bacterium]|nr:thiol:disulfide interchange protein DsbA/DsbL [Legionellales bacterium]